jgi:hypothetical protein
MKRTEITDEMVQKIGEGIREYNRSSPPGIIRFAHGIMVPPTPDEKAESDRMWFEAVRHGLYKVCE